MERKIFKYPINITDDQVVKMPSGAEILSIQPQGLDYYLWAIVDPSQPDYDYKIEVMGTGHPVDNRKREYITTVQNGSFVWHFFLNL